MAKRRLGGVHTFGKPERDAQVRIQPWWDVNKAVVSGGGAHAGGIQHPNDATDVGST